MLMIETKEEGRRGGAAELEIDALLAFAPLFVCVRVLENDCTSGIFLTADENAHDILGYPTRGEIDAKSIDLKG